MKEKHPKLDTIQAILMTSLAIYCGIVTTRPAIAVISFALGGIIALNVLLHIGMYWLPSTKDRLGKIRDYVERHDEQYNLFVSIDLYGIVLAFCVYATTLVQFLAGVLMYYVIFILIVNIFVIWRWIRERKQRSLGRLMTIIGIIALAGLTSCGHQSGRRDGGVRQSRDRSQQERAMQRQQTTDQQRENEQRNEMPSEEQLAKEIERLRIREAANEMARQYKRENAVYFTIYACGRTRTDEGDTTITIKASRYDINKGSTSDDRFDLRVIKGSKWMADLFKEITVITMMSPTLVCYVDPQDIITSVRLDDRYSATVTTDDVHIPDPGVKPFNPAMPER